MKRKIFAYSYCAPLDKIFLVQRVDSFYGYEREAANFVFCGVYSREEDDLSSSKGHRNTQSNLRERLTNISDEIIGKYSKNHKI